MQMVHALLSFARRCNIIDYISRKLLKLLIFSNEMHRYLDTRMDYNNLGLLAKHRNQILLFYHL